VGCGYRGFIQQAIHMRQKVWLHRARAERGMHLVCSDFLPQADTGGLRRERQRALRCQWLTARRMAVSRRTYLHLQTHCPEQAGRARQAQVTNTPIFNLADGGTRQATQLGQRHLGQAHIGATLPHAIAKFSEGGHGSTLGAGQRYVKYIRHLG